MRDAFACRLVQGGAGFVGPICQRILVAFVTLALEIDARFQKGKSVLRSAVLSVVLCRRPGCSLWCPQARRDLQRQGAICSEERGHVPGKRRPPEPPFVATRAGVRASKGCTARR